MIYCNIITNLILIRHNSKPLLRLGRDEVTRADYKKELVTQLKGLLTQLIENLENIKKELAVKHKAQWRVFYSKTSNPPLFIQSLEDEDEEEFG